MSRMLRRQVPLWSYVLALAALAIGIRTAGWRSAWTHVFVPAQEPAFLDMRTVQAGLLAVRQGIDPQVHNPTDPLDRPMDYPRVWLRIGRFFQLDNERCYLMFCVGMIVLFAASGCVMLYRWPSFWLLACLLSPATLLAMERGNNDLLMFFLVFLFAVLGRSVLALLPALLAVGLKVFPVFGLGSLLVRREERLLLIAILPLTAIAWQLAGQVAQMHAGVLAGRAASYGLANIALTLRTLGAADAVFGLILSLVLMCVLGGVVFLGGRRTYARPQPGMDLNLFLAGGGIYVGTFVVMSNWDYRLIFLSLCIPHLSKTGRSLREHVNKLLLILIALAMSYQLLAAVGGTVGKAVNLASKVALFVGLSAILLSMLWGAYREREGDGETDRALR